MCGMKRKQKMLEQAKCCGRSWIFLVTLTSIHMAEKGAVINLDLYVSHDFLWIIPDFLGVLDGPGFVLAFWWTSSFFSVQCY